MLRLSPEKSQMQLPQRQVRVYVWHNGPQPSNSSFIEAEVSEAHRKSEERTETHFTAGGSGQNREKLKALCWSLPSRAQAGSGQEGAGQGQAEVNVREVWGSGLHPGFLEFQKEPNSTTALLGMFWLPCGHTQARIHAQSQMLRTLLSLESYPTQTSERLKWLDKIPLGKIFV